MNGSPVRPSGHLQTALWLFVVHSAVSEHGLDAVQGLIHWRLMHVSDGGQSSLDIQPTDDGAPKWFHKIKVL